MPWLHVRAGDPLLNGTSLGNMQLGVDKVFVSGCHARVTRVAMAG